MSQIRKIIEVEAESDIGWEHAAQQAVSQASLTLEHVESLVVERIEARIENSAIVAYRLRGKIAFAVQRPDQAGP